MAAAAAPETGTTDSALAVTSREIVSDSAHHSACPLGCSAQGVVVYPQIGEGEAAGALMRCPDCDMMWLDPVPSRDALREFYANEILDAGWDDAVLRGGWPLAFYKYRLDQIARYQPPGRRVLDVGVGFGHFLRAARDDGWDVTGIDISPEAADYVKTRHGLTIDVGEARDVYADGSFDCIHSKDVLEHITDPLDELRAYRRMLKPGGVLVIETLNIGSIVARVKGARYPAFVPGHVVFFSPATLQLTLQRAGFETLGSWAGDEVPWPAYFQLRPWTSVVKRLAKKVRVGSLYFGSMVMYARLPAATAGHERAR